VSRPAVDPLEWEFVVDISGFGSNRRDAAD
jgi:hypothetical protein